MNNRFPVEVRPCSFGNGVFALKKITKGSLIEVCQVIPLTPKEFDSINKTVLGSYVYTWIGPRQPLDTEQYKWTGACVGLGYAMLYNHSFTPNAEWKMDVSSRTVSFYALEDIPKEAEIFHHYFWPDWKYTAERIKKPKTVQE